MGHGGIRNYEGTVVLGFLVRVRLHEPDSAVLLPHRFKYSPVATVIFPSSSFLERPRVWHGVCERNL